MRITTQRGAATLLTCLALTIASIALAISVAHTATLEQRMARNSLLANQAQQAANAGLNFGSAWLKMHHPDWLSLPGGLEIATPTSNPPAMSSSSGDSFAINLTFERAPNWLGYILVRATASPSSAPEIEARVSQYVRPSGVLTAAGEFASPLIVDGCADLSTTSDLYPASADLPDVGPALSASGDAACLIGGGTNLHGGQLQGEIFPSTGLWDYVFSVPRDELLAMATAQVAAFPHERDYWWATADDLSAGEWRHSIGSPQRPIILVIPAELGCPGFSGGAVIVGFIYIEADCTGAPAWGDFHLYGSLAVTGQFNSLGPSSRLAHIGQHPSGPNRIEPPPLEVIQLAGSWKDF
ncbi:MAG: hypothetical protein KKA36_04510 [Gammaproteobacteria bacterium]|nr:hypothetical protein [Gammaproteobacteria bacterium]MBU2478329.1 hypothetical protein [Gammaproteobacteria bacterium]